VFTVVVHCTFYFILCNGVLCAKFPCFLSLNGFVLIKLHLYICQQVLKQHRSNMFAANGIGILYAEKAKWDVAKELFTQVRKRDIKFIVLICCFT